MKLVHRYIFKSVLGTSLAAVGLYVFVLLAGNALRDIVGLLAAERLTLRMFSSLLLLLIPYVFSYALPLGMLTGILMVLGRLSSRNEIVALKAAGLSLWFISAPIFAIALMGVVLSALINNYYAPNAKIQYKKMLSNVVRNDPLRFIVVGQPIHEFPGYVLYVGGKKGKELENFWIWELDERNRAVKLLRARSGLFEYDQETDSLGLTLHEGFSELRSKNNPDDLQKVGLTASFREAHLRLPLDRILGKKRKYPKLSILNLNRLLDRKNAVARELERLRAEGKADSGRLEKLAEDKIKAQLQIQKNFAMAFSILSFALIGIPLGIKVGRRETYANLALALSLAMGYYVLIIFIGWLEKMPPLRPDLLIWLPNLVFQALGLWLLIRANRH